MSYIVKTKGRKFIVDADSHKDAVKKVRDSLLKDGYSYEDFEKDLEKMGIKGHTSTLFAEAKRGLPNLKRVKELSGGWWKDVDAERIYKLAMNVRDSELSTNNYEKEFGLVGKTHDELIQSGSEEALQKNIATEIKAGKDPKQAAAIAYSIQRENDDLFNVYDIEYLNAKSVAEHWKTYAKTEEEAIKNFEDKFKRMGLSKTSILNIVQTNKIEDSTDEDYTNSTYTNGNYTLKILNKVKPGEYGVNNAYNIEWNGNKQKLSAEGISMAIRHNKMYKINDSVINDATAEVEITCSEPNNTHKYVQKFKINNSTLEKYRRGNRSEAEQEIFREVNIHADILFGNTSFRILNVKDSAIKDAEIPHITKEQWNKIPKEYKTTDPKTGKKQAFAGSLGIAPGGTTLLTEGMHFIIDSEEKNYTYIMFGTTGEKRVDNLTKAEAEHLLKNNKLLGYDGKIVETKTLKDAKQEYRVNYHNSYTGRHAVDYVEASNVKEALRKFGRDVALRGDGTANINVHSISPNEGYQRIYGKLSELLKNKDFQDSVEDDITNQQYFTDKIEKAENVDKFTLWKDEEGYYYLDATIRRSGKRLQRLNTKDINEARKKAKEMLDFVEDDVSIIKDAYYNIGGYASETDKMLKQDISKARSYGLKTYIEKVDGSYQLTVEGSYNKVKKIVEDYFAGDVSSIGDKQVFSEETMNSVQRGIEKDYENMNKNLEELHDTFAPKEIEDLPIKARQELRNAKEKGPKLLEILSQLQDIVNKASAEEKAEVKYKAEKILADLKKQFGLERETYIKLDSAIKDERLSPMTYSKLKELGYDQDDWKDLTQEQANELVAKGRKEITNKETSNEENSTIETKSTNKNIEKYEVPEEYDASKWTETEEYTKFMKEQFKTGDPKVSEYGLEFKGNFSKEDLDKVRNYFDGEGLDILETKDGIMLSQGADYVDDQEEYEEFAKQREEWLNQENKPKIENNPENRGRWLELIKKQFDEGELSEEERKELEELDAVINPPKTEEQKERDKEKTKLNTELETLKSELKPNNRYYWKKSEIKEKEDRIAELERKIAELESK